MWSEIGNQLRQAREEAGLSLDEIRDQTKIDIVTLGALENGDFDKISSPFFVRSHIRAYAKIVGLEPTYLLKKYRPIQDGDEQGSGLGATGTFSQQTASWTPVGGAPELQSTGVYRRNTGPTDAVSGPSGERQESLATEEYDPYRTRHSEPIPRVTDPQGIEEPPFPPEEGIPSRTQSKKKLTERLTESTLKLPALRKSLQHRGVEEPEEPLSPPSGGPIGNEGVPVGNDAVPRRNLPYYEENQSPVEELSRARKETAASRLTGSQNLPALRRSGRQRLLETTREMEDSGYTAEGTDSDPVLSETGGSGLPSRSAGALVPYQPPGGSVEGGLSRTAARKAIDVSPRVKGAAKWAAKLPKTWMARLAVFAAIILIPMTAVWAFSSMKEEPAEGQGQSGKADGTGSAADGETLAQVISVNKSPQFSEYKLSQPSAVDLRFKAQESSWVQIRDQKDAKGGYLKDVTLKPGEEFPFRQEKEVNNDLWVTIGAPQHVEITVNGQTIDATKSIHIIRESNEQ